MPLTAADFFRSELFLDIAKITSLYETNNVFSEILTFLDKNGGLN